MVCMCGLGNERSGVTNRESNCIVNQRTNASTEIATTKLTKVRNQELTYILELPKQNEGKTYY